MRNTIGLPTFFATASMLVGACNASGDVAGDDGGDATGSSGETQPSGSTGGDDDDDTDPTSADSSGGTSGSSTDPSTGARQEYVAVDDVIEYHEDLATWYEGEFTSVLDNDSRGLFRPFEEDIVTDGGHEVELEVNGRVWWDGNGSLQDDSFEYSLTTFAQEAPLSAPATVSLQIQAMSYDLEDLRESGQSQTLDALGDGARVTSVGDLNGDGYGEIAVRRNSDDSQFQVIFGSADGLPTMADVMSGAAGFAVGPVRFARSAGDFNADGFDDLFVRARLPQGTGPGTAAIVLGGPSPQDVDLSSFTQDQGLAIGFEYDNLTYGDEHYPAGDVNGDGYDDVMVGDQNGDSSTGGNGTVVVVFGRADMEATTIEDAAAGIGGMTIEAGAEHDFVGQKVAAAGDVNGDGVDDTIVFGYESGDSRVWVVFGTTSPGPVRLDELDGRGFEVRLRHVGVWSIAGIGDIDGDGFDDIAVSDSGYEDEDDDAIGRIVVVWGKDDDVPVEYADVVNERGTAGFTIRGGPLAGPGLPDDTLYFAEQVIAAGDLNDDGYADFAWNHDRAWRPNPTVGRVGRVFVAYGRPRDEPYVVADLSRGVGGFVLVGGRDDYEAGRRLGAVPRPGGHDLLVQRQLGERGPAGIDLVHTDDL